MNPTFLKYEANQTPQEQRGQYDPIGIVTIGLFNNQVVLRYVIKPGKEARGFYISEFSQKLNGEWNKSHTIDSNVMKEQIESLIKANLNPKSEQSQVKTYTPAPAAFNESELPF